MEFRLRHIIDHLYNIFLENMNSDNCYEVLKEEFNTMFGVSSMNAKHDCNDINMNSLNIHDANDMQSHKLGDAMFDEDNIFNPLMRIFIIMKACLLFMMTILMKVDLERS